jgi:G8 domain
MNRDKRTAFGFELKLESRPWFGRTAIALLAALCMISCGGTSGPTIAPGGNVANLCSDAFSLDPSLLPSAAGTAAAVTSSDDEEPKGVPLSSCTLGSNNDITIGSGGCGPNVYVDKSFGADAAFGTITIKPDGKLAFLNQNTTLYAGAILDGGLLSVGTFKCRIAKTDLITIHFTGKRPCPSPDTCGGFSKGIEVMPGGHLRMVGAKGVPDSPNEKPPGVSWTYINAPAGVGATLSKGVTDDPTQTLFLADDVRGDWQTGDWITVAGTGFSPFETEFVQIAGIRPADSKTPGGAKSIVDLMQPLKNYHFGSMPPTPSQMCKVKGTLQPVACGSVKGCKDPCTSEPSPLNFHDGADRNYGVDERAEVGLISRSIKLTGDIPSDANSSHWGGEIKIVKDPATGNGPGEVVMQGVELEKFGKDQLGSYPVHFHMDGDLKDKPLVDANSVHHSFNKCITVHSTQNLTVSNNVCARITGHIFYQETGDENGIAYINNLGLGAMSNNFAIKTSAVPLNADKMPKDYWEGDYLANDPKYGFDPFKIPDTDDQANPTRGACATSRGDGGIIISPNNPYTSPNHKGACASPEFYYEPASGFWITNPTTVLKGNSIGGCQGAGRGIWYVAPKPNGSYFTKYDGPDSVGNNKFNPLGEFFNNRVHGCYAGLYDEGEDGVFSEQLFPHATTPTTLQPVDRKPLVATLDGVTVTRIRDRGIWVRPTWFLIKNARAATSRDNVTLVSSGGLDGNAPGVWALLEDSVVVGLSTNNVDRWGPCPTNAGQNTGCVDQNPDANDNLGRAYQTPAWNSLGYLIYDGPVRIFNDRFVHFKRDISPELTANDSKFLASFTAYPNGAKEYEGDAALGWFNSNQSAYPTATASKGLIWDNVDLRHQIFTQEVNLAFFNDGDKNTAILDEDGTLSGFKVVDAKGNPIANQHPISLNNLAYNAASNSVDECHSEGQQDTAAEDRPTSLMSVANMSTLEFGALWPKDPNLGYRQALTFTRDTKGDVQTMTLVTGRNGLGVWEPKVASGFGYLVTAAKEYFPPCDKVDTTNKDKCKPGVYSCLAPNPGVCNVMQTGAGIPDTIDVGLTDPVKPDIKADDAKSWFYVRVGVCYTGTDGSHPKDMFTITSGYKSYGGGNVSAADKDLQNFWNKLEPPYSYQDQTCNNLDAQVPGNLASPTTGCPADGVAAVPTTGCTDSDEKDVGQGSNQHKACVFARTTLTNPSGFTSPDKLVNMEGTPDLTHYSYDPASGMLFFYVAQKFPNPIGPSPLGSCTDTSNPESGCPEVAHGESYYACPAQGCPDYIVRLGDSSYMPGESDCGDLSKYYEDAPKAQNQLAYSVPNGITPSNGIKDGEIVKQVFAEGKKGFPHHEAEKDPYCPESTK